MNKYVETDNDYACGDGEFEGTPERSHNTMPHAMSEAVGSCSLASPVNMAGKIREVPRDELDDALMKGYLMHTKPTNYMWVVKFRLMISSFRCRVWLTHMKLKDWWEK